MLFDLEIILERNLKVIMPQFSMALWDNCGTATKSSLGRGKSTRKYPSRNCNMGVAMATAAPAPPIKSDRAQMQICGVDPGSALADSKSDIMNDTKYVDITADLW